jgi:hypothetical protein
MLILLSFTHYFSLQRYRKIKDIRRCSVLFCRYFKVFILKIIFKKVRPLFGPFFGIFRENSAANFSGRTYFCRAPFEFCGRNFGPLATLIFCVVSPVALFSQPLPLRYKTKSYSPLLLCSSHSCRQS